MEPQIRETDTWNHIVQLAERYDTTMYKTGAYRGKGGNQNTGNRTQAPKRQFNNDVTNTSRMPAKGKGQSKALAKRKHAQKNEKPTKAEMDRRKAEGACFYCGEKGHMAKNALRKKSSQTMFASLKKQTAAKQNTKQNQMKQRISMERTQS